MAFISRLAICDEIHAARSALGMDTILSANSCMSVPSIDAALSLPSGLNRGHSSVAARADGLTFCTLYAMRHSPFVSGSGAMGRPSSSTTRFISCGWVSVQ